MMRFTWIFLAFLLIGSVTGCKRLGCNNVNSMNFDIKSKKDDGSCVFQGNLVLWMSQFQSNNYVTNGITDLHFIVNNELIGTHPASSFSTAIPTCAAPSGGFLKVMQLGKVDSKNFTVIVRDDQDNFLVEKQFVIKGNGCTVIQL